MKITGLTDTPSPVSASTPDRPVSREEESPLQQGRIIQATVARTDGEEVCLEWNGRLIRAQTHVGLQQGQRLTLQVATVSPHIELHPLGLFAPEQLGGLLHSLDGPWELESLLNGLRQALPEGASAQTALQPLLNWLQAGTRMPDGTLLAKLLRQLGVVRFSERETGATVRTALAELSESLPDLPAETARQADRLLQSLDLARQCNLHLLPDGSLLLPLPLPFLDSGYLLIDHEKASPDRKEGDPRKLTLLLSLKQLGALRVDILWNEQDMMLKFTCDTPEKACFLATFEDELREVLNFRPPGKIYFSTGQIEAGEELIGRLRTRGRAFVDARV